MDGAGPAKPQSSASANRPEPAAQSLSRADRREDLLDDVDLLIDYLGRHRPGRLDACFEDSRGDLSRPAGVPTAPMVVAGTPLTKAAFLHRWATIGARTKAATDGQTEADPAGLRLVDDVVFLVAARDFLAALAWPATVDTIGLTRAYVGDVLLPRSTRAASAAQPAPSKNIDFVAGRRLRQITRILRSACVLLALFTVAVSLLGFGGKRLLEEQDRLLAFLGTVTGDLPSEQRPASVAAGGAVAPSVGTVPTGFQLAYCDEPYMDASGAVHYRGPQQEALCNRLWGINRVINQLNTSLEAWGNFWPTRYGMLVTGLSSGQSEGRVRVFDEAARRLNLREARLLPAERNPNSDASDVAGLAASELALARQMVDDAHMEAVRRNYDRERHRVSKGISPTQAKVMIEALSLYIMPCLYAVLGAFVAMFQQLRRRADTFTLDRSDSSQAIQTLVFGLVFGALVGILADMLRTRPASGAASDEVVLGVSVIALVAGYSVAHVFRFLDNFADRLFGSTPQARDGKA